MKRLSEALQKQLRLNERKNLLHAEANRALEIEPTFLAAIEETIVAGGSAPCPADLDELASTAAAALIDRIYAVNQYLQVPAAAKDALAALYRQTWEGIAESRDVEATLRDSHYPRLAAWLGALYPRPMRIALGSRETLGAVTCQDYSAELQLRLLRLRGGRLRQPVLDIGCGRQALLVSHLRQKSIAAFGLDRVLKTAGAHLRQADWLEASYEKAKWGTILSNMAFSNHFVYVRQYEKRRVKLYRSKYLEILEALQPKGSFVYGPAAPDLEQAVDPKRFSIEKWTVAPRYGATRVTRLA